MINIGDNIIAISVATVGAVLFSRTMRLKNKSKANRKGENIPLLLTEEENKEVVKLIGDNINDITNDSLIKITRQLKFWLKEENLSRNEILKLTERLISAATWRKRQKNVKVPKVRFGRTELQMPIITCGSMRFQHTWMPDFLPIAISKNKVVKTTSQDNLINIVRQCISIGVNHFETARMYGTSEIQLVDALCTLMERGEIQRSDFIYQTKIPTSSSDVKAFEKYFEQSWENCERLGFIDLMSFWCVSKPDVADYLLSDDDNSMMSCALKWKEEGRIKHIGFSTHGSSEVIMRLIDSNKFDYVNLHYHFFGSYHAEGTPDTKGGHGNLACVKKALELDMGVFNISPVDKGGQLFRPSSTIARLVGPKMSPITFASLHAWETAKMHTVSVGFARPEDLDEILEAAEFFTKNKEMKVLLKAAESRLLSHAKEKLGTVWAEKSLLNIPTFFDEVSGGIGIGHIIWCHNMLNAYGMYDTAKARYTSLETSNKWNNKKSFAENVKVMGGGNPGFGYIPSIDLKSALQNHCDPVAALERIKDCHKMLQKSAKPISAGERSERGWDVAYDLRPWTEFPDTDKAIESMISVVLQNVTFGYFGAGGGPSEESISAGEHLRIFFQNAAEANKISNAT